jgi:hypothetical protein
VGVVEAQPFRGHAGIADWVAHEIREVGERVLVRTMVRARGRGSSVELTADAGMVFECQDCRIMRFWSYLNWHEALEAVGLSE